MEVILGKMGHKGHALAEIDGQNHFIAYGLEGERVTLKKEGSQYLLDKILEPSELRIKAKCRHFTKCGSCAVQHLRSDAYEAWKQAQIEYLLDQNGIEKQIDDYISFDEDAGNLNRRRRVKLAAKRTKKSVMIGYHKAQSHDLIEITECPIASDVIIDKIPALKAFIKPFLSRKGVAYLSLTDYAGQLELVIDGGKYDSSDRNQLEAAIDGANKLDLARLVMDGELVVQRNETLEDFAGVLVDPVAGGFMQAVKAAELKMAELTKLHLSEIKGSIVDLFCGIGTFSFPLAQDNAIHGYDSEQAAILSFNQAVNRAGGNASLRLKKTTSDARDLFTRPLFKDELNKFDAAIMDPPRAGAAQQVEQICESKLQDLVYISCNPNSFMKDAKNLIDAGFELEHLTVIDQFKYSAHLELVAKFAR